MSYQTAGEGRRIQQQGNRTGIPPHIQKRCEAMSGVSFDDVRIHYGSGKPAELGALAYTQGSHVYIGPGQERYLGHELGHVMQQKQGRVKPNMFFRGMAVNDDRSLEREADRRDGTRRPRFAGCKSQCTLSFVCDRKRCGTPEYTR